MDTWEMIRAERAQLVEALSGLSDDDWSTPSLAAGWNVRDVVGHMTATAEMTPPKFVGKMASTGFRFNAMNAKGIAGHTEGKSNAEILNAYRARIDARTAPPGPTSSWLGETIVHGEDIFRALGGYREHPIEHVLAVAEFYKNSNLLIGAKRRVEGVKLSATDATWHNGSGPEVSGPAIALVMAMTGRKTALDDLSGDGVAVLRDRP